MTRAKKRKEKKYPSPPTLFHDTDGSFDEAACGSMPAVVRFPPHSHRVVVRGHHVRLTSVPENKKVWK